MIKKYCMVFLFLLGSTLFTGCNKFSSPEHLIEKPKKSLELEQINKKVKENIPEGAELIIPLNSKDAGAINYVDIDGDNESEIIAFYKKADTYNKGEYYLENEIIVINSGESMFEKSHLIQGTGYDLLYAGFYDLDEDGNKEIVTRWNNGDYYETQTVIYDFNGNSIEKIFDMSNLGIEIDDIDENGKLDIISMDYDEEENFLILNLYGYKNNIFECISDVKMCGDYLANYSNVKIGMADVDKKGIFIDISMGYKAGYTELIILEKNKLKKVFFQGKSKFPNNYQVHSMKSTDIDKDGIIEIGLKEPIGFDYINSNEVLWVDKWHKWDGKNNLVFVLENYLDTKDNFQFKIPLKWQDKYVIEKNEINFGKEVIFYSEKYYPIKKNELLKIIIVDKVHWNKNQVKIDDNKNKVLELGEDNYRKFIACFNENNLTEDEELLLDEECIRASFKIIN